MNWDTQRVLDRLLLKVSGVWSIRYPDEPGYLIKKLSPEDREAISKLKSDDMSNMRPPHACEHWGTGQKCDCNISRFSREKLEFDKKLKRYIL